MGPPSGTSIETPLINPLSGLSNIIKIKCSFIHSPSSFRLGSTPAIETLWHTQFVLPLCLSLSLSLPPHPRLPSPFIHVGNVGKIQTQIVEALRDKTPARVFKPHCHLYMEHDGRGPRPSLIDLGSSPVVVTGIGKRNPGEAREVCLNLPTPPLCPTIIKGMNKPSCLLSSNNNTRSLPRLDRCTVYINKYRERYGESSSLRLSTLQVHGRKGCYWTLDTPYHSTICIHRILRRNTYIGTCSHYGSVQP